MQVIIVIALIIIYIIDIINLFYIRKLIKNIRTKIALYIFIFLFRDSLPFKNLLIQGKKWKKLI